MKLGVLKYRFSQSFWSTDPYFWVCFFIRPQSYVASIFLSNQHERI